jgi:hypothetical protein
MIDIASALISLQPTARWEVRNNVLLWSDTLITQPTDSEIQAELTRLQAVHDSQQYSRDRQAEYPSIEECVHAILDNDLDALQVKRQAVKTKYPKE